MASRSAIDAHPESIVARGFFRSDSWPRPMAMTALSIDECAWSEQYTRRRGTSLRPAIPSRARP